MTVTPEQLAQLREDVDGFSGRFAYVRSHGALVFMPDEEHQYYSTECENWHVIAEDIEQHIAEPIARMLNAVRDSLP